MKSKTLSIFLLVLLLPLSSIFADDDDEQQDPQPQVKTRSPFFESMTGKEVEAYIRTEHNRSNIFYGELSILGGVEFFDQLKIRGGFSVGRTEENTDIHTLLRASYAPFERLPLSFSLAWIYNGIPEYEANTHTLLPLLSFGISRAGVSAGIAFRFSSFFGEEPQFESIFSFSAYVNAIDTQTLQIGFSAGTFSDFQVKNLGAMSLKVHVIMNLDENWTILNEVEWLQSGVDGFSANFYGFAWRGGVKYSW